MRLVNQAGSDLSGVVHTTPHLVVKAPKREDKMAEATFLAADLGASSGRIVAGRFDGNRLELDEIHRFPNGPVAVGGTMYWDALAQWREIQDGLRKASDRYPNQIKSVGVDTWGVDYALLTRDHELLGNPVHHRDRRTDGVMQQAFETVPRDKIFAATGLQFLPFNTLFQLLAMRQANSAMLEVADALLMMPDLFHWMLSGEMATEMTNATTTQFFDPQRGCWATELLDQFELPTEILQDIAPPGTRLGHLRHDVAEATGLHHVDVVLPGTHDTASAVLAVPAARAASEQPDWCYISSGTWSLMGVELPTPLVNDRCSQFNFTNEGGVGGTTRLLKNIAGLWLVQECRRAWALSGRDYSWDDLTRLAASAPPRSALVDPDATDFLAPTDMPNAIQSYCRRSNQKVPNDEGAIIRCAVESIALKCRYVLGMLEELTGGHIETIHIVGGGTQNRQLCQATADACGRRVLAGPVEATAIGNIMMQAIASGAVGSISEARAVIRTSFPLVEYEPQEGAAWQEAFERFKRLVETAGEM